jgi:hypothetical protein
MAASSDTSGIEPLHPENANIASISNAIAPTVHTTNADDSVIDTLNNIVLSHDVPKVNTLGANPRNVRDPNELTLKVQWSDANKSVPATKFVNFSALPRELRDKIWKLCVIPQLVIWCPGGGPSLGLSRACTESRHNINGVYEMHMLPLSDIPGHLYALFINWEMDLLYRNCRLPSVPLLPPPAQQIPAQGGMAMQLGNPLGQAPPLLTLGLPIQTIFQQAPGGVGGPPPLLGLEVQVIVLIQPSPPLPQFAWMQGCKRFAINLDELCASHSVWHKLARMLPNLEELVVIMYENPTRHTVHERLQEVTILTARTGEEIGMMASIRIEFCYHRRNSTAGWPALGNVRLKFMKKSLKR